MILSKDKLEAAEKAVVDAGLEHFLIMCPPDDDGKMVTMFHQMKSSETINLLINAIPNAIDHELGANPDYTKEYKKIFTDFRDSFKKLVVTVNQKVEKFNVKDQNQH